MSSLEHERERMSTTTTGEALGSCLLRDVLGQMMNTFSQKRDSRTSADTHAIVGTRVAKGVNKP